MKKPVDVVAEYMRANALAGKGVSYNTRVVAQYLGLSCSQVSLARDTLVDSGRLLRGQQSYLSIDGVPFKCGDTEVKPHDKMFNWLRRRYTSVVDARVVDHPEVSAPKTRPGEIIIGSIRTDFAFAAAAVLCAPGSRLAW